MNDSEILSKAMRVIDYVTCFNQNVLIFSFIRIFINSIVYYWGHNDIIDVSNNVFAWFCDNY